VRKPRYGDELVVEVLALDERGRAVGRASDDSGEYRVRLAHGLPGELVRAKVLRRRRERLDAHALERLRAGRSRVEPRCVHFGVCGGCSLQDLAYAAQLEEKRRLVAAALGPVLGGTGVDALIGAAQPWRYRNKMDFTFGTRRWVLAGEPEHAPQGFALGLHPREQYRKVLDVSACEIAPAPFAAIVVAARAIAQERGLSAWQLEEHRGLLRHLVLRSSRATGEVLAQLVTSEEAPELVRPFAADLLAARPEITTLVQTVNTRAASVAAGERELVLHGPGSIRERLAGLWFTVSASSFFQTNTAQAERLVEVVLEEAAPRSTDAVLDLYCGAGTLSLPLARGARAVAGVELVAAAVEDARRNAAANGIANASFAAADALAWLAAAALAPFELIVADPPRAGLHPRVAAALAGAPARRIVLVSCNPLAAARDLAALAGGGWRATRVRPIDLFPHTPHVECVIALERRP
jgi:23S rRNA (uracil1939-C5)-methyltransferase